MRISTLLRRAALGLLLAQAALLAPHAALAQGNSSEAAEAARRHRAEQAVRPAAAAPARARQAEAPAPAPEQKAWRSSANPNADPRASLKSCMDHAGLNPAARDRCFRQHCQGRWGQGDCPASGGDMTSTAGANSRTPLGQCLTEAGSNPFRRDACGWKHCNNRWGAPECLAIKPKGPELAN